jgi:hypothetical protein
MVGRGPFECQSSFVTSSETARSLMTGQLQPVVSDRFNPLVTGVTKLTSAWPPAYNEPVFAGLDSAYQTALHRDLALTPE